MEISDTFFELKVFDWIEDLKWDIEKAPVRVLLYGGSGSGKTHLLKFLMIKQFIDGPLFKFGRLYSSTHEVSSDYDYLPDSCKRTKFDINQLMSYINNMRKTIKKNRTINSEFKTPPNFIIFDDMLGLVGQYKDDFRNFIATCRHTNTSIFFTAQQHSGAGTTLKSNLTHAFIFITNNETELDGVGTMIGLKAKSLLKVFRRKCKEKYQCLLYINHVDLLNDYNENGQSSPRYYRSFKAPADLPDDVVIIPNSFNEKGSTL